MTFPQFVRKMLSNKKFRGDVRKNPAKALTAAGMKPTARQLSALKKINYSSVNNVARAFDDGTVT